MAQITNGNGQLIQLDLPTEIRNPKSMDLHLMAPEQILELINDEDSFAIEQAKFQIPNTAKLVDLAVKAISDGNSVHYFGAGTSGRIATQDAAELYPTFHSPAEAVQAHMAGGMAALLTSVENAEDDIEAGATDAQGVRPGDVVIGLAASGRTPYVGGAMTEARARGAKTALIACVPEPQLAHLADVLIAADTGPEILTGSTRLKAATFQKSVLSGFSTALMVGLGRTYSNLMVSMVATNEKLHSRSIRILREGSGVSESTAVELLRESGGDLKLALTSAISGFTPAQAQHHLQQAGGVVQEALEALAKAKDN
jgi:N-acetylmuramic acid 6-phosphate etherase